MDKDIMKCFIGKVIKVDRGGPESKIGMLLDASDDLIVLLTEDDGVVYYNTKHIKSLTDNIKGQMEFNLVVPKDFEFIKAANFKELLDSLKFKWIKINRGGPDKLEGVLTQLDHDFVFLINNQEIVRLSMFHIKSISYGLKIEKAEEEKSNKQQSRSKEGKSKDSSQKNKSNSKNRTSKKTTGDEAEMALAYPLSTNVSSQETIVEEVESNPSIPLSTWGTSEEKAIEDVESDLSIPLLTSGTSQETSVEDAEYDLSALLSTLEKFLRKYV